MNIVKTLSVGIVIGLLALSTGCSTYPGDPAFIGRRIEWFERTDPHVFFEKERKRGVVYFISFYDSQLKGNGSVPGISRNDPYFDLYRTWLVPSNPDYLDKHDPTLDAQYKFAVERFAETYNPIVLKYLRETGTKPASSRD